MVQRMEGGKTENESNPVSYMILIFKSFVYILYLRKNILLCCAYYVFTEYCV